MCIVCIESQKNQKYDSYVRVTYCVTYFIEWIIGYNCCRMVYCNGHC